METRRKVLTAIAGAVAAAGTPFTSFNAFAADDKFPGKPIRLIVPYPAGGGSDAFARLVTPKLTEELGQQIVVDNRPGAATMIGAEMAAKAAPDGYTILLGDNSTYAVNTSLYKKMSYDPAKDFMPITLTARFALVLVVNPSVPANSLQEFVALAKSQPGKLSYGSPGAGSPHHLAMEMFMQRAGITMLHVPYKGGAPATQDLLGGTLPVMMADWATASQHIAAGKMRALAAASAKRLDLAPNLPTIAESGYPGYEAWAWQGVVAPANTPQSVINTLNAAFVKVANDADVKKRMREFGGEFVPSTPGEMTTYMKTETVKWAKIVKDANITVE